MEPAVSCPLCIDHPDLSALVIYQDATTLIRLDPTPLSRGHAVAILRTHRADITDPALASGEHAALLEAVQRVARGMKAHLRCDRVYAITMSDVVQHLHYHLVPRYPGEAKGFPFWTEKAAGGAIPVDRDALEHLASALRHAVER